MPEARPTRRSILMLALVWPICGCGSGGTETVKVSPEAQKKVEDYIGNYQKKMQDQHKPKSK